MSIGLFVAAPVSRWRPARFRALGRLRGSRRVVGRLFPANVGIPRALYE